jgi:predicted small lipoprotein YifL
MEEINMKKILAVLFAALMLFSFTACRDGGNADLEAMKAQMKLMQQQLDEAKQAGFNPSGERPPRSQRLRLRRQSPPRIPPM